MVSTDITSLLKKSNSGRKHSVSKKGNASYFGAKHVRGKCGRGEKVFVTTVTDFQK